MDLHTQTGMMPSGNNLQSLGIKPKPELTREQINMTVDMLERINNCMKREGNDWYDTGDFMLMLSNDEMKKFRKLIKTLNSL